jgi:HlyD family secretion protein
MYEGNFMSIKNRYLSNDYKKSLEILITSVLLLIALSGCNHNDVYQGYIEGNYTYVSSPVGGQLEKLLVSRGSTVKADQLLYVLDQEPELSNLQHAKNALEQSRQVLEDTKKGQRQTIMETLRAQKLQATAQLDLAKLTFERYQKLLQQKVLDKASFDQSASDYRYKKERLKEIEANIAEASLGGRENLIASREAEVASMAAEVKKSQWLLDQKSMTAPTNAFVFDTLHEVGEYVSAGQPIVVLLAPTALKVIFFIPEKRLYKLKVGDEIQFLCTSCKTPTHAQISFISNEAEYTPPVIFSKDMRDKLVYRIEARLNEATAKNFQVGQPVDVTIAAKK